MSVQYSDVPAGDTVPFPPAIPQGMLYRVSSAKNPNICSSCSSSINPIL